MERTSADPLIGRTVAHYEVIAKLGGGGMGVVYTARDTRLGRLVALKFLPPQWSHDDTAKQRFIREAQAASATNHRNICTIHDIGTADDGQLFIVMACYEGRTLKQALETGPLSIDDAVDIAAQVAEGLAKAHAQGVVHRDIKPGNLMLTEDGVRILDFGLAKFADALQLTIAGSTLGTVAYMSPEQARAEDADPRSDVWALGVVLYEMLAGTVPFKGMYAEAIAHAIRTDAPPPLERNDVDVPEALRAIVTRALQKDPAARYQSAREMARDLRLLQGRTIPIDLRTERITAPAPPPPRRWWATPKAAAVAALVGMSVGAPLWLFSPADRVPAVVVPVINQTGYAELDGYRMALTQELAASLGDSDAVRVLPYDRELQILRRFRAAARDVSSSDAIQALTANSDARLVIVPTLLYENGSWRARVELRDAMTATTIASRDTAAVVSSLAKEAAYGLMPQLGRAIDGYLLSTRSTRADLAIRIRRTVGRAVPPSALPRMRTLDAAAAFEQGVDAYEQQEHQTALAAFARASQLDPQNPLPAAWRSRVARIMRHDDEASAAAQQAQRLVGEDTSASSALFIKAIAAEARRDAGAAEAAYRELTRMHPDDATWRIELAGLLDRQLRVADAIGAHYEALKLDPKLARPHLEMCRLYGPARLNDPPKAKQEGTAALAAYRALGARAGEAQTLWCLADALNVGTEQERAESQRHVELAARIFEELAYPYNLSRAYNYVALSASAQGRYADAASYWERSLKTARAAGNVGLAPAVITNLAVTYRNLGDRAQAVSYLQEGYRLFEALGDQQRAAQNQVNAASLLIEYGGGRLEDAVRDTRNAFAVFQKLGDKNFQVFSLQVLAAYYRNAGRHGDAERELNRALALARASSLDDEIARITTDLARSNIERADYATARTQLAQAIGNDNGPDTTAARIYLALADARAGDLEAARRALAQASSGRSRHDDAALAPLLNLTEGELAYQAGDLSQARQRFSNAASLWQGDLPDAASVEARAYVALLDAVEGRAERARTAVQASVEQARKMRRRSLEARCLVVLARIELQRRRPSDAIAALDQIAADDDAQSIGPELRAMAYYWRGRALAARGDRVAADTALREAKTIIDRVRAALPEAMRASFAGRPDVRQITSETFG